VSVLVGVGEWYNVAVTVVLQRGRVYIGGMSCQRRHPRLVLTAKPRGLTRNVREFLTAAGR
jgi:hypothetical protein